MKIKIICRTYFADIADLLLVCATKFRKSKKTFNEQVTKVIQFRYKMKIAVFLHRVVQHIPPAPFRHLICRLRTKTQHFTFRCGWRENKKRFLLLFTSSPPMRNVWRNNNSSKSRLDGLWNDAIYGRREREKILLLLPSQLGRWRTHINQLELSAPRFCVLFSQNLLLTNVRLQSFSQVGAYRV